MPQMQKDNVIDKPELFGTTDEEYEKNKVAGLLQLPYLIWVTFATYLNFAIYLLNR